MPTEKDRPVYSSFAEALTGLVSNDDAQQPTIIAQTGNVAKRHLG